MIETFDRSGQDKVRSRVHARTGENLVGYDGARWGDEWTGVKDGIRRLSMVSCDSRRDQAATGLLFFGTRPSPFLQLGYELFGPLTGRATAQR